MLIGILECGRPPDTLKAHGSYPAMFERMLGPAAKEFGFRTYAAIDGDVPDDAHACDAWLVTGSRHGAYERAPWMLATEELLRKALKAEVPVIGICFGHQLLAQALGGTVVKSEKGWGFGLHDYALTEAPALDGKRPDTITVAALHQDQVVDVPKGGRVIGSSPFCPNAIIAYGDTALTFQPHPEFDVPFLRGLSKHRLKGLAPDAVLAEAETTFQTKTSDQPLIAHWIARFLLDKARAKQASAAQ